MAFTLDDYRIFSSCDPILVTGVRVTQADTRSDASSVILSPCENVERSGNELIFVVEFGSNACIAEPQSRPTMKIVLFLDTLLA